VSARPELGATRTDGAPHRPIVKEPTWTGEIPMYFYAGGLAGASAGFAYLTGLRGADTVARRAWLAALAGAGVSPVFLISDLGRPARFLNMLRMFKVTSPMSVGSWILSGFGAATGVATLDALTRGKLPPLRRAACVARPSAALLGLPLASYTGALISDTAIPVWHEARALLPAVFVGGAAASAGGVAVAVVAPEDAAPARRLAIAGAVAELVLKEVMEKRLGDLEASYKAPVPHRFTMLARLGLAGGLAALVARGRSDRRAAVLAGGLLNAGALAARWSIFKAGFVSAARPEDTVGPQRARIASGATRGAVSRAQPGARPVDRALASPATASPAEPG
jgi:DMSO reductase anchor subunit